MARRVTTSVDRRKGHIDETVGNRHYRLPGPAGLIHHSDRGAQYLSADYQTHCGPSGCCPLPDVPGCAWDNTPCESWLGRLKVERVHPRTFPTRAYARTAIYDYIEVYHNRRRRHSALGYHTPVAVDVGDADGGPGHRRGVV